MKVVIDARMYGLEHAGIGRYVVNLIREIKEQILKIKNIEIVLLVRKINLEEIKKEFGDLFKIVVCDAPHYSLKEQIILPLQLIKLKPNLVHFPHFNVPIFWWGKYVVTIHDLIKHESRGMATTTRWRTFYWLKYAGYKFVVWLAINRAAKIIVPSRWWKKELVRQYKLPPKKIVVTYEGVEKKFKIQNLKFKIENVLKKYKVKKPYLIYTGSLYPHKNVERLVKAVQKLQKSSPKTGPSLEEKTQKLQLVIVCARSVFYQRFLEKVEKMDAKGFVNLVGFVPDKDLTSLYHQAEAFILPTLIEGFGLIGLEAMAAGCPVLASNIPVLKEVYGEAALYFDPYQIDDITEKIQMVTSNKLTRNKLIRAGLEQVKKYSWQGMAKKTLEVYHSSLYP